MCRRATQSPASDFPKKEPFPMNRTASAVWHGDLMNGAGTVSTQSGILSNTQYGFRSRFESGPGTNPEELIAAAHAGCFAMALSAILGGAKITPDTLQAKATVTLEQVDGNWTVTKSHLDLTAKIPGISQADFEKYAGEAEKNCPISRVLKAEVTLDAKLEG
jgi:osmotically inducible protein OsmC